MMVRRRTDNTRQSLPLWVTNFDPSAYPADTFELSWVQWRMAVNEYCQTHNLLSLNFGLWLTVTSNVYQVRTDYWQTHPSEHLPTKHVTHLLADLQHTESSE